MEYVIEANKLCKDYDNKHKILKEFDIHVPKGSIYGLVGKNGAGKTTFMRVICGIQPLTSGEFKLFGVSSSDVNGIRKARGRIGSEIEIPSFYLHMNARDNLLQQFTLLGIPSTESVDELLKLVGLENTGKKTVRHFSLGMKQRLGIAMALAGNPDCIILDEPMNGLDPEGIIEMRETILKLNKERDITFVISSHILDELSKVATNYGFISDGRLVEEIAADEIEAKCRKAVKVEVSDTKVFSGFLEGIKSEYTIDSDTEVIVYGDFDINTILPKMVESGIKLKSLVTSNESLESYYLDLLGSDDKNVKVAK